MINWDEVTVGETEIVNPCVGRKLLVAGQHHNYVWLFDKEKDAYHWQHKEGLRDWTIYDPWEEITERCRYEKFNHKESSWLLEYEGFVIRHDNKNFKISEDGRRVWKRKEGDGNG